MECWFTSFASGESLLLENLALRQQLAVLKRRHPRPRLELLDKLFWVAVRRCGHARNGGALAQGRIPFVLEADLQGQEARRETTDLEGDSGIDLPNGRSDVQAKLKPRYAPWSEPGPPATVGTEELPCDVFHSVVFLLLQFAGKFRAYVLGRVGVRVKRLRSRARREQTKREEGHISLDFASTLANGSVVPSWVYHAGSRTPSLNFGD